MFAEEYLSITELAERLQLTPKTIRNKMSPFLVAANGQRDANGGLTSIVKAAWSNLSTLSTSPNFRLNSFWSTGQPWLSVKYGGPNGNRTRVPDVRGRCPNR